jgi:3-isopropylmalate dehydratase small subunit
MRLGFSFLRTKLSDARSTAAFALVHAMLLALGNEPAFAAHFFENAIRHHLPIEPAQQAVERLVIV